METEFTDQGMHEITRAAAGANAPADSQLSGDARLGERLRTLRVSAGLTQTQLGGERFSKAYISQIERGTTRPTRSRSSAMTRGFDRRFLRSMRWRFQADTRTSCRTATRNVRQRATARTSND